MGEIGVFGRALCAGVAFTAVAIESACHSTYDIAGKFRLSGAQYTSEQSQELARIKRQHDKEVRSMRLQHQKQLLDQENRHSAEVQQLQDRLSKTESQLRLVTPVLDKVHETSAAQQSGSEEEEEEENHRFRPANKTDRLCHKVARESAAEPLYEATTLRQLLKSAYQENERLAAATQEPLSNMLNSAYQENDRLTAEVQRQHEAAEELASEVFRAAEMLDAQQEQISSLHQEVQSLQAQLTSFYSPIRPDQPSKLQPNSSSPLDKVTRDLKATGWLPSEFCTDACEFGFNSSCPEQAAAQTRYYADVGSAWGQQPEPAAVHDLAMQRDSHSTHGSSPCALLTPESGPGRTLTPRLSSDDDSVFDDCSVAH